MKGPSLLSDELLRHLMAVGQVDVVVGLPTLNHAATVGGVVRAAHAAFAAGLKRERTVLLNVDGGSTDGTADAVREASLVAAETLVAAQPLRTVHGISAPYHGLPGKGAALRTLFAAAELLDARAFVLLDPDVTSVTPEWVGGLARPVLREGFDYVAPVFSRAPGEGPLVTQLARPLVRAAYGRRVLEPLASELGCSVRYAAHCLTQDVWSAPFVNYGIDVWLTTTALAGGFRCAQAALGPRRQAPRAQAPSLPELLRQVVGALFACLERHQAHWVPREGAEAVETRGEPGRAEAADPPDPAPLAEAFRAGVRDLAPVLGGILEPATLEGVKAAARDEVPAFPDALWVATVVDFAAAFHGGRIHRDHLLGSLVPLYLGRVAWHLAATTGADPAGAEEAREGLCLEFERAKPELVRRWNAAGGR